MTAEAGYGKTTVLAQLARTLDRPVAWYTVTEAGRDPSTFLASLMMAIEGVRPGITFTAHQVLGGLPDPAGSWRAAADALLNDLARGAPDEMLVVLDDVHVVADSPAGAIPPYLAAHLPRHVRLALLSRTPLREEIARLVAQGEAVLLDGAALAFTADETSALLAQGERRSLSADEVALAHAQTEGWAVALQLLKQALAADGGGHGGRGDQEFWAGPPRPL